MGVTLSDTNDSSFTLELNFWHWGVIEEIVFRLGILAPDRFEEFQPWGAGITATEAKAIAAAIRTDVLPRLNEGTRLLLDGTITDESDDGVFHKTAEASARNYSTDRDTVLMFVQFCDAGTGFSVTS